MRSVATPLKGLAASSAALALLAAALLPRRARSPGAPACPRAPAAHGHGAPPAHPSGVLQRGLATGWYAVRGTAPSGQAVVSPVVVR